LSSATVKSVIPFCTPKGTEWEWWLGEDGLLKRR
jgi:hypothetical protein